MRFWFRQIIFMWVAILCSQPEFSYAKNGNEEPTFFLVSVGVDKYESDFWPDLQWATKDAKSIAESFGKNTGFKREIVVLTNKEATSSRIKDVLLNIKRSAKPQDYVVFYISSHGSLLVNEEAELEPILVFSSSKEKLSKESSLTQSALRSWVDDIGAKRKLLVFATCHSGLGKSRLPENIRSMLSGAKGKFAPLEKVSEGTLVLAASSRGETARELNDLKGDIYTHFLIEGLNAGDRNQDGRVTALEAHDYAMNRTYALSDGKQRPTAEAKLIGEADIPLFGKRERDAIPILQAYNRKYEGLELSIDGSTKAKLPLALPLKKGKNIVYVYSEGGGKTLAKFQVKAREGDEISLDSFFVDPPFVAEYAPSLLFWQDDRFTKLLGTNGFITHQIGFSWNRNNLRLGLQQNFGVHEKKDLWDGLESDFQQQSLLLSAGYSKDWIRNLYFLAEFLAGVDAASIALKDEITGKKTSESSMALAYGLQTGLEYNIKYGFGAGFKLSYIRSQYEFGQLGDLDATRYLIHLNLLYKFGGVATKL